ncbi:MAG: tetratricopeptide repeat protein [Deltaproteobacteria bacterium]
MSLILDVLKRVQKDRLERKAKHSSTIPPWFSQRETKRFFRPKFLLLILMSILIPLFTAYYMLEVYQKTSTRVASLPSSVTSTESFPILKEITVDSIADHSASMREAASAPPPQTEVARIGPPPPKIEPPKEPPPKKAKAFPKPAPERIALPQAEVEKVSSKPISEQRPPVSQERAEERELSIQKIPSSEATNHFNLGLLYHKNNKLPEAIEEYKKAVQIDPFNTGAHNNLGMAYKDLGRYEEAVNHYQKALSIDPKYGKARHNLAVALYQQGDLERAALELNLTISSNPKMPESYNNLGLLYKKLKKFPEAREFFQKGLSIDPKYASLHYNLALTLEEEGDLGGAIFHYQKFVELSAGDQKVLIAKVKRHVESLSHGR